MQTRIAPVFLLLIASLLCDVGCTRPAQNVVLPADQWTVAVVPAPHIGPPGLFAMVNPAFQWPHGPGGHPITYHVAVVWPGQGRIENVGQLTADERFAVVFLADAAVQADLASAAGQQQAGVQESRSDFETLRALVERRQPLPDDLIQRLEVLLGATDHTIARDIAGRGQVWDAQVVLVPYEGDRGLARQETTKQVALKYTWGKKVDDAKDPCNGKTPEECALDRLKKIKDAICGAKNPDQSPTFPDQCARLTALLGKTPPEPKVECTLPAEKGVSAGVTDAVTLGISINGEFLLTDACADATVLHELTHAKDLSDPNKFTNLKKFRDAERRMAKALADYKAAKAANDEAGKQKAAEDFVKAKKELDAGEQAAGGEMVETECNALFAELDYPGSGPAWWKEAVKAMIGELANVRHAFHLEIGTPPVKGPMCDCFTKMQKWVKDHKDVKDNFDKDIYDPQKNATTSVVLDTLTKVYCK